MDRFIFCTNIIRNIEGGFNYIKEDKGGMTIFGISRVFNKDCLFWDRIDQLLTPYDLKHNIYGTSARSKQITNIIAQDKDAMKEINDIYYNKYWASSRAYSFKEPLDLIHFDAFFNMGETANKIIQKWAGVEQDGILGKKSMKAIKECQKMPKDLLLLRWEYYKTRENFKTFKKGWKSRLEELAKTAGITVKFS